VISVTSPSSPAEVAHLESSSQIMDLQVLGGRAYAASWTRGLEIAVVDVPDDPSWATGMYLTARADSLVVSGSMAYATSWYGGFLRTMDVADPAQPTALGIFQPEGETDVSGVDVSGDYAFVTDYAMGLRVVDVSEPASPEQVGFLPVTNMSDVVVVGEYAYVTATDLLVVDVSEPTAPTVVGRCCPVWTQKMAVDVEGDYAYVGTYEEGLWVIDIRSPGAPFLAGKSQGVVGIVGDVAVSGDLAYTTDPWGSHGLQVVDISTPTAPVKVGSYGMWQAAGVAVTGHQAYVIPRMGGLVVLDVSTPSSPQLLGIDQSWWGSEGVATDGSQVYVVGTDLVVLDGCQHLFDDGFETGDTALWSAAFPTGALGASPYVW